MYLFDLDKIKNQLLSQKLLQTITLIAEYKGKQDLFKQQAPQTLDTLRIVALAQSTESSNRIEGITAHGDRLLELVQENAAPLDRSEREIAGYRDVLSTIHNSYESIPFTPGVVLQLHRDLYRYEAYVGGKWKSVDNEIVATNSDGTREITFRPLPAYATPDAMLQLHQGFNIAWESGEVERLLLIPTYILDFLCIHPFLDGNGRMSRLLTLLLLYKAGYEVGRYISLERIVEQTKQSYYSTLRQSSVGWHLRQHQLLPWWDYFLGMMLLMAYREFEQRVTTIGTNS